jgi:predicted amidohydrolase
MCFPLQLTVLLNDLIQPSDPIQTFLNAYTICSDNWESSYNLLQDQDRDLDYVSKTKKLLAMLRGRSQDNELREAIHSTHDDEILVGALALLTALAKYIGETQDTELSRYSLPFQSSAAFGGVPYWLARDRPAPFGGGVPSLPRRKKETHDSLQNYHDPLLVTPGKIGEWTLTRIGADRTLENLFAQRLRDRRFRISLSPLSYEAEIHGESQRREPPHLPFAFHLTSIGPQEQQLSALHEALQLATAEGAAILVLPELRMPPPLLTAAKKFLRDQIVDDEQGLLLVAAGSWHVEDNGRHNRCVVLNQFGEELWTHDKLREYVITKENVEDAPEFFKQIGVGEGGGSEAILRGRRLEFYDSVIGRVATAICVGFFSQEIEPLLQASEANVLLVPAMTPSITALEARAEALVHSQHAATFVANCGCVSRKASSFYQLPTKRRANGIRRLDHSSQLLSFDLSNV